MQMSSSAAAAFELPSMPGPYEDFEFSLNLPENITDSDLNLVASPGFGDLFGLNNSGNIFGTGNGIGGGGGGGSMSMAGGSGGMSNFSASTPVAQNGTSSGTQTPNLVPTGLSWKNSPKTPHKHDLDDTMMTSSFGSQPSSKHIPSSHQYDQQHQDTFSGGMLGLEAQSHPQATTSMPTSQSFGPPSQPPMAPFPPPAGGSLWGNPGMPFQSFPPNQQQQNNGAALFDANETNFLTNFLSGFEGWDFNPNLPMDLPSFAEAEKQAHQMGATPPNSNDNRRNSRQRSAFGSIGRSGTAKGSPHATFGTNNYASPAGKMESSIGAAFGHPMEGWNDDDDEDEDEQSTNTNRKISANVGMGKKMKTEHGSFDGMQNMANGRGSKKQQMNAVNPYYQQQAPPPQYDSRELLSESEKRSNHILSEQRRRNHIREAFKELVDLLEAGRDFGARGLGLSSGAGTGIEDEGLDDRSDYESTLEDEEQSAATKRRKLKARRRAALEAARKAGATGHAAAAAFLNGSGRGKGRGRGGSAGGGAGSKSAVLFQTVDLLHWLNGRNEVLSKHVQELEEALV